MSLVTAMVNVHQQGSVKGKDLGTWLGERQGSEEQGWMSTHSSMGALLTTHTFPSISRQL